MTLSASPTPRDRLARALRRLRWPVVIAWVLAIVLLRPIAAGLSGATDGTASAYLPAGAPSTRVVDLQEAAQQGRPTSDTAIVVFARAGGLTAGDRTAVASARSAVARLVGAEPGLRAPGPTQPSADGQSEGFTVAVASTLDSPAVAAIRRAVEAAARDAGNSLEVQVTGSAALSADSGSGSQTALLLTALLVVAVILLLVYRSPILWLLPLVGAIGAIVVAQAAAHGLANAGVTVSSLSAAILIVLAFGAASDYALLLIHRYREELRHHAATEDAMAAALRRTLPTLVASAATVTGAMLCLLAAVSASLHGLGPVGAVAIVAALLAQTTFLPALLLVVGRRAFWPRVPRPGEAGHDESRAWASVGARIVRHPAPIALAVVVVLGAACTGLAALQTANNPLDNLKGDPGSVVGAQLLAEHYGVGVLDPLVLLAPTREASAAAAVARGVTGVASVSAGSPVGGYADYSVTLSVPPFGQRAATAIQELRSQLDRQAPGSLVGGDPAIQYDIAQAAGRDALLLIPLMLMVIFVVIALLLRAIVAPLVLVATTAFSFGASFGLAGLLWRYGLGYAGIESQLPIYIFVFLVALGVDYNIFLSARIREESRQQGTTQGTLRGLGMTGDVITAAGIVMAGTFAALAQRPLVDITEVGTAVAIGVLLDTLLVRTVLVPATLVAIGDRVWWPGRAAAMDQVRIEDLCTLPEMPAGSGDGV